MASIKLYYNDNCYLTVTYTIDGTSFNISEINGYYKSGKAGDASNNYSHTLTLPGGSGTVKTFKGKYASGYGYGWNSGSGYKWGLSSASGTGNGTGKVSITIKGSTWNGRVFTSKDNITLAPKTKHVNGYIRNQNADLTWGDYWHWINQDVSTGSYQEYWGYGDSSGPDNDTYNVVHWAGYVNDDTTFHLDASRRQYTISYAPNGGSSTPSSQTKIAGANLTLRGSISRNNGSSTGYTVTLNANQGSSTVPSLTATNTIKYTFSSWKDSQGATYSGGGTYTKNYGNTLTAQWSSSTVAGSVTLPTSSTTTRTGYTLSGWNTKSDGTGTNYSPGASYTPSANITLYAKWTLNAPSAASVVVNRVNRTRISVTCSYTGAALSNYTVYYRANSTGNYSSKSFGTTATDYITGLNPNTPYQIYVKATNAAGSKDSSTVIGTTMANTPVVSAPAVVRADAFDMDMRVVADGDTNASITNYTIYWGPKPAKNVYDMAIKTLSDGSMWARIFYHQNNQGTTLFESLAECKNVQQQDKYSRLYLLEDNTYKRNGKFEFMLTYPNNSNGYNRWKQTNAPQNEFVTETTAGTGTATGYEAVHIDWTSNYWGGLTRQKQDATSFNPCYLSGSVGHNNWFYAIGASSVHGDGIPSATDIGGSTSSCVELWVRIDDETTDSKSFGSSNTGNVDGLSQETEYVFWGQATNAGGTTTGPLLIVTTPADQAKIRIKDNGEWKKGKAWYKKNGAWVKAKKIYIKKEGQWVIGYNYEN